MTEQKIAETKKYSVTCSGEHCSMFVPAYSGKLCRFTGKPIGKSCGSPINKHGVLLRQCRNIAAMIAIFPIAGCALDVELTGKSSVERDGETICEEWRLECRAGTRPDAPIPDMVDAEAEAQP